MGLDDFAVSRTIATPDGPFSVIATGDAVLASGWTDDLGLLSGLIHPSLREAGADRRGAADGAALDRALAAVRAYYDGDLGVVGSVPVRQLGGAFMMRVWEVMRGITPGSPVSYGELAARAGKPSAARAAGSACSHNAAALFVPCHRVIRADGTTGAFAYGPGIKAALLARESGRAGIW